MFKKPPKVLPLKFLFSHPAHLIAGGFGSGYSPWVPGTTGTLFAWGTYLLLAPFFVLPICFALFWLAMFALGVWACQRTGRDLGVVDHGSIVWDEIVPFWGVLWFTQWFTPNNWMWQLAAFVLFRIFDILKPQPARYFDEKVKNGFGVMTDDFFAAVYAVLCLHLLTRFFP
ncbi:MAG TPA: phosphatidylglycerophosphatase A [Rhodocyclaceae bacterium]|jgi:phosphatidylglycerophosphatase A|nr:phosphatidylglycerophosphatase A [Rhodocyclaceae bacterium]